MKALSIGRDQTCDIVINDSTDVISRRHAILNISSSGKITLIDQSRNGTYVNGIRISPNVPVPVSRKDIISFAHVAKLDWNAVPTSNVGMRYALIGAVAVLVIACGILGFRYIPWNNGESGNENTVMTDTLRTKPIVKDTPVEEEDKDEDKDKDEDEDKDKRKDIETLPLEGTKLTPAPVPTPKDTVNDNKGKGKPVPTPKDTINDNRPIG